MPVTEWGSEIVVSGASADAQQKPAIAALADGGFIVVWETGAGDAMTIEAQRFDAVGDRVGANFQVGSDPHADFDPSVTGVADGGFVVGWTNDSDGTGSDYDVYTQRFTSSGSLNGAAVKEAGLFAGTYSEVGSALTAAPGTDNFVVSFADSGGHINFVASSGAAGSTTPTGTVTASDVAVSADGVITMSATVTSGGVSAIYAGALFGFHQVNTTTGSGVDHSAIAALGNGDFAVVWQENEGGDTTLPDQSGYSIRGQLIAEDSTHIGSEFVINTTTAGDQSAPDIVATADGGFLVTWQTAGAGGIWDIDGQVFNADGQREGGQFTVNTETTDANIDPHVALLADGRVAVAWDDNSAIDGADMRVQIVDPRDGIVNGDGSANTLYGNFGSDQINGFAGNDYLLGLGGDDQLLGGAGNDTLDGGLGGDRMVGGVGNDLYVVDNLADQVVENAGEGHDRVKSFIDGYNLAANVEDLHMKGSATIGGGNELGNRIVANDLGDKLSGLVGDDIITGGAGADTLTGGAGRDHLTGGAGADTFAYLVLSDSQVGAGRDLITDFGSGDRIDLSAIDADTSTPGDDAFQFIGHHGFSGVAGQLSDHYHAGSNQTIIEGDVNGDGVADFQIALTGDLTATLTSASFVL